MEIETFLMERNQSLYENQVAFNLTESGVEALSIRDLLNAVEIEELLSLHVGYGHTEGTPELRAAIAAWYPGARTENVLVTTGTSEANLLAGWVSLSPGDEIVFLVPNFMQLSGVAPTFGAKVKLVSLDVNRAWRPDFDKLEAAITPKTRMIALCNPNNPTGRILPPEDMERLAGLVTRHDAWLLSDEIYRGAELGGRSLTPSFWGLSDKVLVTSGLSKSFAHPGLRLGWLIAPGDFVAEAMRRQDYTTIGTSPISQFLAEKILAPGRRETLLARGRAVLDANLEVVKNWVAGWGNRMSLDAPEAGGMAFVGYDWPIGSEELARRAREEESVFFVAGAFFGLEGHMRIGIGGDPTHLKASLDRLDRVLKRL